MYQRLLVFEQNKTKKELAQKVLVNDLFFNNTPPPPRKKGYNNLYRPCFFLLYKLRLIIWRIYILTINSYKFHYIIIINLIL